MSETILEMKGIVKEYVVGGQTMRVLKEIDLSVESSESQWDEFYEHQYHRDHDRKDLSRRGKIRCDDLPDFSPEPWVTGSIHSYWQ